MVGYLKKYSPTTINKLIIEGLLDRKKGMGTKVVVKNIGTQPKNWMSFTLEMNNVGETFIDYEIIAEKIKAV